MPGVPKLQMLTGLFLLASLLHCAWSDPLSPGSDDLTTLLSYAIERASNTTCLDDRIEYRFNAGSRLLAYEAATVLQGAAIFVGLDNTSDGSCHASSEDNVNSVVVVDRGACGMQEEAQNMMVIRSIEIRFLLRPASQVGQNRVLNKRVTCTYPSPGVPPLLRPAVRMKVTSWFSPLPLRDATIYQNDRINLEFIPFIPWYSRIDRTDGMPISCQFVAHRGDNALRKHFFANGCSIQEQLSNGSKMELFGVQVSLRHSKRSKTSFIANQHLFSLLGQTLTISCHVLICSQGHVNGVVGLPMCPRPCSADLSHYANDTVEVSSEPFKLAIHSASSVPSSPKPPKEDPPCPSCPPVEHTMTTFASLSIKMTAIVTFISFALGVTTTAFLWFLHNKTRRKGTESRCANEAGLRLMTT